MRPERCCDGAGRRVRLGQVESCVGEWAATRDERLRNLGVGAVQGRAGTNGGVADVVLFSTTLVLQLEVVSGEDSDAAGLLQPDTQGAGGVAVADIAGDRGVLSRQGSGSCLGTLTEPAVRRLGDGGLGSGDE